jgi:hypothetical protein
LVATLSAVCFGQLDRGTLTGVVSDSSGAVIPGARVTITNAATGVSTAAVTTAAGQFTVPNLPSGFYNLTFEAQGFKKLVVRAVELGATEVRRVDAVLELGAVTEVVHVTAEMPRLATDAPEVGTSLSGRQLVDLPLSIAGGRFAGSIAFALTPGVHGSSFAAHINGSTTASYETLLDGAPVTTNRAGHFGEQAVSMEALQELKVQTSGISAEFGRMQAGVFNYVMKSGSNQWHGSAFGALRNEALNANTFVNNFRGVRRPLDRQQTFALSGGGPVRLPKIYDGRNRSFFYATYERWRNRDFGFGAPNATVPLPEFYEGDFSRLLGPATNFQDALGRQITRGAIYDPATFRQVAGGRWVGEMFPGNRIPVSRFSRVSRNLNAIARKHYLPTVRDANGEIPLVNNAYFPRSSSPEHDQHQFSLKVDQVVSSAHRLSGSYSYNFRPRKQIDGGMWDMNDPDGGPLSTARKQLLKNRQIRLGHDWVVSPTLLNVFKAYYNRQLNPIRGLHSDVDGAGVLGITNLKTTGYPVVNWGGGPFVTLRNPGYIYDTRVTTNSWGILETFSASRGRHFLKFGVDIRRNHNNVATDAKAQFNFSALSTAIPGEPFSGTQIGYSFASYLLGIVHSGNMTEPVGFGDRRRYYALFLQDDFKFSQRLTLQLGLRWEFQPPLFEAADRLSSWSMTKIDPESGRPGAYEFAGKCDICTGQRSFGRRSYREFGPRFGFAYRVSARWTLRGAYGIFYEGDLFNGGGLNAFGSALRNAWGGTWDLSADPVNPWAGIFNWDAPFPTNRYTPSRRDPSWGNRNQPAGFDPDYGLSPYMQQWNFNLQRALAENLWLDVGYVGNKGTRLRVSELKRVNQLHPSVLSQYGALLTRPVRNEAEAAQYGIAYPFPGYRGTVAGALRDFPQIQGIQTVRMFGPPLGFSTHHSLQITVNRQFSGGLSLYANYVWAKTLANVNSSAHNDNPNTPLDYYNLRLEKAYSDFDVPHALKAYATYELPFGQGKRLWRNAGRIANLLARGWNVSAIVNYYSGTPLEFLGSSPIAGGWNGAVNRANVAAGALKNANFRKSDFNFASLESPANTYLDKSKFSDPMPLTLGTAAPNYGSVRGFGQINEDLALFKNTKIGEQARIQLRMEALNAFNRSQLRGIITNVNHPLFGQVTSIEGARTVQLGLRLDF